MHIGAERGTLKAGRGQFGRGPPSRPVRRRARLPAGADAVALDGQNVYFSTLTPSGSIVKVPKAGGATVTLASNLASPDGLAVDATHAYFTTYDDGQVAKVPVGGGNVVVLAFGQSSPDGIVVDATHVYWANNVDGGAILKTPR